MFRSLIFGASLVLAAPASAATLASFDTSVGVTLQASPAEEVLQTGGYLPGPSSIVTAGDVTLLTGDDNSGDSCCMGAFVTTTTATFLGEAALSATGSVHSIGSVQATGERRALLLLGNYGAVSESITLTFDIQMMISQVVDALVGGAAASATEVTIQRDGETIFNHALSSLTDDLPLGASYGELFVYSFDLAPTDSLSTQFRISVAGGVHASSNATEVMDLIAPVPLPAGAVLLLAGLGALGVARRMRG